MLPNQRGDTPPRTRRVSDEGPTTDNKVVSIFSPGHGRKEHAGRVTIVDQKAGPDEKGHARQVSNNDNCRDPYPLSKDCFLVAAGDKGGGDRLVLMDGDGKAETLFTLKEPHGSWIHEPRPIRSRKREPVIPTRTDTTSAR